MYYRIAAFKKDDNQREVTIRANSREEVKAQMERIKAFLFPGEDTTNYFYQMAEFRELVNNTIHMSFFRVFVCRPVKPDKEEDLMEESAWYENVIEAKSIDEARAKAKEPGMLLDSPEQFADYELFVEEVGVETLIAECEDRIRRRIKDEYLYVDDRTVREYCDLSKQMEKDRGMYYEALKGYLKKQNILRFLKREAEKCDTITALEFFEKYEALCRAESEEEFNRIRNSIGKEV